MEEANKAKAESEESYSDEAKQRLLQMSEISLQLDGFDDIFSDFDPRPYSQRALSVDFLDEAKRASRDKASGIIELQLLVPEKKKDFRLENVIRKRLREHFKRHHAMLEKETREIVKKGLQFAVYGIIMMFFATLIAVTYSEKNLLASFLVILLEPAGWFFFWMGLDQVVFKSKEKKPDTDFYKKMAKCEIVFRGY